MPKIDFTNPDISDYKLVTRQLLEEAEAEQLIDLYHAGVWFIAKGNGKYADMSGWLTAIGLIRAEMIIRMP